MVPESTTIPYSADWYAGFLQEALRSAAAALPEVLALEGPWVREVPRLVTGKRT